MKVGTHSIILLDSETWEKLRPGYDRDEYYICENCGLIIFYQRNTTFKVSVSSRYRGFVLAQDVTCEEYLNHTIKEIIE